MKRRTFVTLSGTVGIASAVSGASVASSVFSSINSSILLEDFNPTSKKVMEQLTSEVAQNLQAHGLDEKYIKDIVAPTRIITNNNSGNRQKITFKNKSGDFVSLTDKGGKVQIKITKSQ